MKKKYMDPEMELLQFRNDVITDSEPEEDWGDDSIPGDFN